MRLGSESLSRAVGIQTPPPDELSDPSLTPLQTYPGIKFVARSPCCDDTVRLSNHGSLDYPALAKAIFSLFVGEELPRIVATLNLPDQISFQPAYILTNSQKIT